MNEGKIIAVRGVVVDAEFDPKQTPLISDPA